MSTDRPKLPQIEIERLVRIALEEDLGMAGDLTSDAAIDANALARAAFVARGDGILAGIEFAREAVRQLDPGAQFDVRIVDGTAIKRGDVVAEVQGNARALLAAERNALNFLTHLSGVATLTRRYVDAVAGTKAHIAATRKTLPGLRSAQKWAVRIGGGEPHRYGLFDAVLLKDNHLAASGSITKAIARARAYAGHMAKVACEVDRLDQLDEALAAGVDSVLLDNMDPPTLAEAVKRTAGRAITEASGGVSLDTVRAIAEAGVDVISIGRITHSAPVLDLALDWRE
ncbi:carboxylating nicotinate-nucleotide diphosphorylase [Roseiterribacter gracilis]|uniref:Probable nicotinate-nucleotide pyrophosphorylase [carboxylating] n=1 Tax=Roseiterribacter gracilis TaxID=2812848 RepID=A0A8S8XAP2_9PROT|nr:nicotinate-nucleotide pyrophosphorylase [carboxylating] [Rhodospirillales bacterium TMPK1]